MGNCNCSIDQSKQKQSQLITHDIDKSQQAKLIEQSIQIQNSKATYQKKRANGAILRDSQGNDKQDNVKFLVDSILSIQDLIEIRKSLKKHFIFSQLLDQEIDRFINQLKPCQIQANQYVFTQGDQSSSYYIILEGSCQVEIDAVKKRTLSFGDTFGDLGIIYSAPRSASVLALTKCHFVQMHRNIFKKVMEQISLANEQYNKKLLSVLQFFKQLTQQQQNALASTCQTQTYEQNQIIFSVDDNANSFYIIKQGIVLIKQKNIQLKQMDSFGQNSILIQDGKRTNTLVAKTKCKILSMSRENIQEILGANIKEAIRKNVIRKIIMESQLYRQNTQLAWKQALQNIEDRLLEKDQVLFKQGDKLLNQIYVVLSSKLKSQTQTYEPNSIFQIQQLMKNKKVTISKQVKACNKGYVGKVSIILNKRTETQNVDQNASANKKTSIHNKQKAEETVIADYYVLKKLRAGSFGRVYACCNKKNDKLCAIKVLSRKQMQKNKLTQYVMNEDAILSSTPAHPFLVNYQKMVRDQQFIYFIMQLVQGEDLFDTITKIQIFSQVDARFLIAQLFLVIEHLHSFKIIYRDFKPENVMMGCDGYLKLVDLGAAKTLTLVSRYKTKTIIGTPHYMAPEIITSKGYSFQADLWALGVMTYQLICGKLPFGRETDSPFAIYEQIINSTIKYPRNCQRNCKNFIQRMLSKNPQYRIGHGYKDIKSHLFFSGLNWQELKQKKIKPFYLLNESFKFNSQFIEKTINIQKNNILRKIVSDKLKR